MRQGDKQAPLIQTNLHTMWRQLDVAMRYLRRYLVRIYLVVGLGRVAKVAAAIEADVMIATSYTSAWSRNLMAI
jgi:hypothetical protein